MATAADHFQQIAGRTEWPFCSPNTPKPLRYLASRAVAQTEDLPHDAQQLINWYPVWYPHGGLASTETLREGLIDGEKFVWHSNGQMASHEAYVDGLREGLWRTWTPDGTLTEARNFSRGVQEGTSRHYDRRTGDLVRAECWVAGKRWSVHTERDEWLVVGNRLF